MSNTTNNGALGYLIELVVYTLILVLVYQLVKGMDSNLLIYVVGLATGRIAVSFSEGVARGALNVVNKQ